MDAMDEVYAPHLLELPAELRLQIYALVFIGSSFWVGRDGTRSAPQRVIRPDGCETRYQVLLTCHSIYREARRLWCSSSMWTFADLNTLRSSMLTNSILQYSMRHVHILDLYQCPATVWKAILPNLNTLTIQLPGLYMDTRGHPTDEDIFRHVVESIFEGQEDDYNAGIREVFRLQRTFELSVLHERSTYWKREWHWHVSRLFISRARVYGTDVCTYRFHT